MPRSPPSPAVCQSEGRSLVTLASIWRQGNKAHSRPYSGAGFGGWEGVAWASLESEDELGLRSRSRTELNYPKWSSGACNWEGQGGETSTRSKAEFSSQLNNLEPGELKQDHKNPVSRLFPLLHTRSVVELLSGIKLHSTTHLPTGPLVREAW